MEIGEWKLYVFRIKYGCYHYLPFGFWTNLIALLCGATISYRPYHDGNEYPLIGQLVEYAFPNRESHDLALFLLKTGERDSYCSQYYSFQKQMQLAREEEYFDDIPF